LIAQVLAVDFVLIWELDSDQHVYLNTALGWKEGPAPNTRQLLERNSLEYLTLTSQYPIVIESLQHETRFHASSLLLDHGVICGVSVSIRTPQKALGVLEVFARRPQVFSREDCLLLQSFANILGTAIDHRHHEANLILENRKLKEQLKRVQSVTPTRHTDWDRSEIKHRLSESRERERLRLAQELHDMPIQDLYGLIYQLDDLKDYMKEPEGQQLLEDYNSILHRIVNSLRTICRDLRPPSLSPFGLEVAIRDHVEKFRDQNPGLAVHLHLMRDKQELSDSLRLNLFRVYQQAMHNVAHHAEATEVHIRFHWDEKAIALEVEDNGKGFQVPKFWIELVRQDHFGLVGIAERVESIHGKLTIVSSPGNGTLIRTVVPRQPAMAL
jgi:signal transduction histidine kinase